MYLNSVPNREQKAQLAGRCATHMGLGSTAKKIQVVTDRAEQLYKQVQDLQRRIIGLEESVDETSDAVTTLEHNITEQRALLIALAEQQDLDAEAILADAAIEEAEDATNDELETAESESETKAESDETEPTQATAGSND